MDKSLEKNQSKIMIDFLGKRWEDVGCLGCAIEKGEVSLPGGKIFDGKNMILGADPEIPIPGFLIVNSKRHVNSFSELTREERYEASNIIALAEKALKELNITDEITLVQEERSLHFHIWIFPHYSWMTEKFGKGISHLRAINEYAKENVDDDTINKVLDTISKVRDYFEKHIEEL